MAVIQDFVPKRQAPLFMGQITPFDTTINDTSDYLVTARTASLASIVIAERIIEAFSCSCPTPEPIAEPEEEIPDGEPPTLLPCREMPLVMYREDTGKWDFAIELNGEPLDISSYNIRFTAKWARSDADVDAVFSLTVGSGITKTDALNGEIQVIVASSLTSTLPMHNVELEYDIQIQNTGNSEVFTVRSGILRVLADVSLTIP